MKAGFKAPGARWFTALALIAAASYVIPASAATWSAPKTLRSYTLPALPTNTAAIATAGNGDAIAVWTDEANGSVQYAQQSAGVWSASKLLYRASMAKAETTSNARVVIGPDGTATAVFGSTTPGKMQYCYSGGRVYRCKGPDTSYAKVATLAPGATAWTVPTNLSPLGIIVSDTQIGADANGDLMVLWRYVATAGAVPVLQWSERPLGGPWAAPATLAGPLNPPTLPSLAVGAHGDAAVVWAEKAASGTARYAIRSVIRPAGTAWGAAELLHGQASQVYTLMVGVDGSGAAAASWDDGYAMKLARRAPGSAWGAASLLASAPGRAYGMMGPYSAYLPDLAVNAAGDIMVAWLESEAFMGTWSIEAEVLPAAQPAFHNSWPMDTTGGLPAPRVALSDTPALAFCAWVDNGMNTAFAATAAIANASWSAPHSFGPAVWDTTVSLSAGNGRANAVWLNGNVVRFSWQFRASSYR